MENQKIVGKASVAMDKETTTNKIKKKFNAKYAEEPTTQSLNAFRDTTILIKKKRCQKLLRLYLSKKSTQISIQILEQQHT